MKQKVRLHTIYRITLSHLAQNVRSYGEPFINGPTGPTGGAHV